MMPTKDEKLIFDLLCGRTVYDKRGLPQTVYLKEGSEEEREARRALARELFAWRTLDHGLREKLARLIAPESEYEERRIRFEYRSKGNRSNVLAEKAIAEFMWSRDKAGAKMESIVPEVKQKFGIGRSQALKIWGTWEPVLHRKHSPLRGPVDWLSRRERRKSGLIDV